MSYRRVIIFLVVVASAWQARAASYYVDYSGGSDTNVGTSTLTPWQHCPGDAAAAGVAGSTMLSGGDIVIFKGGVTYDVDSTRYISLSVSGSSDNPIIYRSGDLAGWGTGSAFIDATGGTTTSHIIRLSSVSWVTIDGIVMGNLEINGPYTGFIGGTVGTPGNITIQNCTVTNSAGNGMYFQGLFGSAGTNPSTITVSNCVVRDTQWHGIFFRYGLDDLTVINCTIFNSGVDLVGGSFEGDNITFYRGSTDQMRNIKVNGNDISTSPEKGHILFYSPMTDVDVSGNYFHGTNRTGGLLFGVSMTNATFYNNVFETKISQYEGIYRFNTDSGNMVIDGMEVYNNSIQCELASGSIFFFNRGNCTFDTMFYNVSIKNCVVDSTGANRPAIQIYANSAGTGPVMDMATFDSDYNTFAVASGSLFTYRGTNYTLAAWRTLTSGDANSQEDTPEFAAGEPALRLAASDTVARGNGVNLSAYFTTDKDGNVRPLSGPWDIGAYSGQVTTTARLGPGKPVGGGRR